MKKKLTLQRETIRHLPDAYLDRIQGAGGVSIIPRTTVCPIQVPTHGCTGAGCVETISTGTSVINPSGG